MRAGAISRRKVSRSKAQENSCRPMTALGNSISKENSGVAAGSSFTLAERGPDLDGAVEPDRLARSLRARCRLDRSATRNESASPSRIGGSGPSTSMSAVVDLGTRKRRHQVLDDADGRAVGPRSTVPSRVSATLDHNAGMGADPFRSARRNTMPVPGRSGKQSQARRDARMQGYALNRNLACERVSCLPLPPRIGLPPQEGRNFEPVILRARRRTDRPETVSAASQVADYGCSRRADGRRVLAAVAPRACAGCAAAGRAARAHGCARLPRCAGIGVSKRGSTGYSSRSARRRPNSPKRPLRRRGDGFATRTVTVCETGSCDHWRLSAAENERLFHLHLWRRHRNHGAGSLLATGSERRHLTAYPAAPPDCPSCG